MSPHSDHSDHSESVNSRRPNGPGGPTPGPLGDGASAADPRTIEEFLDHSPVAIYVRDVEGRYLLTNRRWQELLGHSADKARGKRPHDLLPADLADTAAHLDRTVLGNMQPTTTEEHLMTSDGQRVFLSVQFPLLDADGTPHAVCGFSTDITDHKQAEHALHISEQHYRSLAEAIPDILIRLDENMQSTYVSPMLEKYLSVSSQDLIGKTINDCPLREQTTAFLNHAVGQAMESGKPFRGEHEVESLIGHRWFETRVIPELDDSGTPTASILLCRDITERHEAETERHEMALRIQQSQKFESLGMLAGGIAHEFNNLLVTILGNADLAMRDIPEQASAYESLQDIKQAAIRASELSSQMLDCSGRGTFSIKPTNLNKYVEDVLTLMRSTISTRIDVTTSLEPGLPEIAADSAQLTQVLTNLLSNAVEAINEQSGTIHISTALVEVDAEDLDRYVSDDIAPGRYVRLSIVDDGCGMDERTRQRAFDPFFSTKFTGRGLGLGSVLGIVRGHRGAIRLSSQPDEGTTVEILLAPAPPPAEGEASRRSLRREEWRGEGMVLVVDDRASVLESTRRMLQRLGFVPITATNGSEAVALFARTPQKVQVAIVDLLMPGMDGYETAAELRKLREDLPLIFCSGYPPAEHDASASVPGTGPVTFLTKPFDSRELSQCIQRCLA